MTFINFESEPPCKPNETNELCWQALKILGAYMLDGEIIKCENEPEGVNPDGSANFLGTDQQGSQSASNDGVFHETPWVVINESESLSLSNRPLIRDNRGHLKPWPRPGLVALHLIGVDQISADASYDYHQDQVLFRIPFAGNHNGAAAIFRGFSLDQESSRIDLRPVELKALKIILGKTERALMKKMMGEPGLWESSYIGNTPQVCLSTELSDLFSDGSY